MARRPNNSCLDVAGKEMAGDVAAAVAVVVPVAKVAVVKAIAVAMSIMVWNDRDVNVETLNSN